jgi:hypothetical protein
MKKIVFLSLSWLTATLPILAHTKSWEPLCQDLQVVNICNLTDRELIEILQGDRPEIAVEFTAQTRLPIRFFLEGDLLHMAEDEGKFGTVEIKQSFFARYMGQELMFSSNLTDWKSFLEFVTGTASVGLSVQNGQPSIVVGVEPNRRS